MSPKKITSPFHNRLLSALSPHDLALLRPHLQAVLMETRMPLERPNREIENVYFMERGIASVVGGSKPKGPIEVGIIGCEGMTGLPVVYGNHRSPHSTYIQVAGSGQRIRAGALRKAMADSASLQPVLLKFAQAFMIQTTHTAIANSRGTLEERLARWILMANDRTEGNELPLTHEFLSLMLGVRRPGVTEALHALKKRGLIGHGRRSVLVVDRNGLIKCANGLYGVPESELSRLLKRFAGPKPLGFKS